MKLSFSFWSNLSKTFWKRSDLTPSPPSATLSTEAILHETSLPNHFLTKKLMASGIVVTTPTSVRVHPIAFRWSFCSLSAKSRASPAPNIARVPTISARSGKVSSSFLMTPPKTILIALKRFRLHHKRIYTVSYRMQMNLPAASRRVSKKYYNRFSRVIPGETWFQANRIPTFVGMTCDNPVASYRELSS